MLLNPKLYEINTRVWLRQFGEKTTIADVPLSYFKDLAEKGINLVWLMGIWKTCPDIVDQYCFSNDLTASYSKALADWERADVFGSPYSIDVYEINPLLGSKEDLLKLKGELNKLGIKLILDFIPNHFGAGTAYLKTNPEIFLQADEESLQKDSFTFFKVDDKVFAHGRDPVFPAWTDTVQVNVFAQPARDRLNEILLEVTELCDGVRCDMAMLPMNNVFYNTWIGIHNKYNIQKPQEEFWKESIQQVRSKKEDFLFIAEVYWGLEWELQQLGFNYTYDKRLLERLLLNDISGIKAHLTAGKSFQEKSVRFIENHDEQRAVTAFSKNRSLAAATVISTVMGMKLYYDGQFTGRRVKLPVQLCREPAERVSSTVSKYYNKLLQITKDEIFEKGEWKLLEPLQLDPLNTSYENFLSWQWRHENRLLVVVINYSGSAAQCRLKFESETNKQKIVLTDLLTEKKYSRSASEIASIGLYIELKSYNSHIFSIEF
ncbi:MAG: alpha-amylase family glycosyl hydrolase [Ignavibacteriaceae bacterium]